jgi:hypothetical protein
MMVSPETSNLLTERTWWWLVQKRVMRIELDIYVMLITITMSILLSVEYWSPSVSSSQ